MERQAALFTCIYTVIIRNEPTGRCTVLQHHQWLYKDHSSQFPNVPFKIHDTKHLHSICTKCPSTHSSFVMCYSQAFSKGEHFSFVVGCFGSYKLVVTPLYLWYTQIYTATFFSGNTLRLESINIISQTWFHIWKKMWKSTSIMEKIVVDIGDSAEYFAIN